ncbi:PP2C family protein-serine/threonine phosphatase [Streptomyces sp. WMMB 322]|uniref:PP2C family protein-serine/threonine phosphatase n=1 Tax=Streptomyces sp. WMMB 322 TaxID=1286821 RepID=UPI000823A45D|nr:PP2C family protein-serine/threonine phosphatase [Streptomyces sp. WMMB 322]SCK54372.1 Serine phosphatase RsbU, regulator of sigma subunit [Streptomyces sp. WMMB 322]
MTADQRTRVGVQSSGPAEANAAGARTKVPHGPWRARRAAAFAVPALWTAGVVVWELLLPTDTHCVALLAATPALACAGTGGRSGAWLGGGLALLALYPLGSVPVYEEIGSKAGMGAAIISVAIVSCYTTRRRARLSDELARTRQVAAAAQQALIRPLPPRVGRFSCAAGYLSSARGAAVGGDLYDAVDTAHGVRIVIGDVRGHGLGAVGTVAAVLGSFREAAHDEPRLERVPRRLERALERHLDDRRHAPVSPPERGAAGESGEVDEEFVTVLLLQVRADGEVTAVNCGHPWPYRLTTGRNGACRSEPVTTAEPLPPLGLLPLPPEDPSPRHLRLPPGEGLFLYTDGAEDARDAEGRWFPLADALTAALLAHRPEGAGRDGGCGVAEPADIVDSVRRSLLRHAGGRLPDDVALLALRNDRCRVHGRAHDPEPQPAAADAALLCSCT